MLQASPKVMARKIPIDRRGILLSGEFVVVRAFMAFS